MAKSTTIFVKKLSRNDRSWADDRGKHQSGFYIPCSIRQSGFFPDLANCNPKKPHIFETSIHTIWPVTGETREAKLKHYTNKGSEMHCTRVPRDEFENLTPASLLVGGKLAHPIAGKIHYWFVTIDSASETAEKLETALDISVGFQFGIFDPQEIAKSEKDEAEQLVDEILAAIKSETLHEFIARASLTPGSKEFATQAQAIFMSKNCLADLNPFSLDCPGDALMHMSRDIEFTLYKQVQLRRRASEVIGIITADGGDIVSNVVRNFARLDALFLSASQQRKSRAGLSFEHHISRLLTDGRIRFQAQSVIGGRRPDFIMPSVSMLKDKRRELEAALILSAKTTLRERWKQVNLEKFRCALFLATVDDRIPSTAIKEMESLNINLVVPESLKKSKDTCYSGETNVLSFKDFFNDQIAVRRATLICV